MPDEIIRELWDVKDQTAKDAGNDLEKLCRALHEREKQTRAPVVDRSRSRRDVAQSTGVDA